MIKRIAILLASSLWFAHALSAAVIGTNVPAEAVTAERIAQFPEPQQSKWNAYLDRSRHQMEADQEFLKAEMKAQGIQESSAAPGGRYWDAPLHRTQSWYRDTKALRIADIVVSFQTPAGGWSKNINLADHVRAPGEHFAPDNRSRMPGEADFDEPLNGRWSYVGTFDNGATTMELRFLAKVVSALPEEEGDKYRHAFLHGLDYIFAAQYPNGGWPQVWPLQGGYHDAITYNDGGFLHVLRLLKDVRDGRNEFAFVPGDIRRKAGQSVMRGVQCILDTQIVVDGHPTVWCQQHDALTLKPTSARNYEMISQCSSESAGILMFLMDLDEPNADIVQSVNAAARWFKKTELNDVAWKNTGSEGRLLVPAPGKGPLWARYYEIGTARPIFGDRDKTIHDTVSEISFERRRGYGWFGDSPTEALKRYEQWRKEHAKGS